MFAFIVGPGKVRSNKDYVITSMIIRATIEDIRTKKIRIHIQPIHESTITISELELFIARAQSLMFAHKIFRMKPKGMPKFGM